MGTNYYLISNEKILECSCCGTKNVLNEKIHIGKSSYGWVFLLHCIPERGLRSWVEWASYITSRIDTHHIEDEYGRSLSLDKIKEIVLHRKHPMGNSLNRYEIDGTHCVACGVGTYDMIAGEFS